MVKMADECFYDAAIRHWIDGYILEEQEEYDNAVCMQGFAAECALKAILKAGYSIDKIRKYSHWGEELFYDIERMLLEDLELTAMIDSSTGLRLSRISLPEVLFKNHPGRRYYKDAIYQKMDAEECRIAAEGLIREMARLYLDGYIGG